ncbi:hypothetical protein HMPREF9404_4827 [Eggerthella sp. HGA1]|nr:hypothetical protein HMPREF9404_4827 [Eggerthella sp. HGA1]
MSMRFGIPFPQGLLSSLRLPTHAVCAASAGILFYDAYCSR